MARVPGALLREIALHLDARSLCRLARTCHRLYALVFGRDLSASPTDQLLAADAIELWDALRERDCRHWRACSSFCDRNVHMRQSLTTQFMSTWTQLARQLLLSEDADDDELFELSVTAEGKQLERREWSSAAALYAFQHAENTRYSVRGGGGRGRAGRALAAIAAGAPRSDTTESVGGVLGQLASVFSPAAAAPLRVPIFGRGAKPLFYSIMLTPNTLGVEVTRMYPGVEGMGSGVGFLVDGRREISVSVLHRVDFSQKAHIRTNWRGFLRGAHCLIYVFDAAHGDDIDSSRQQLAAYLDRDWTHASTPLVVLHVRGRLRPDGSDDDSSDDERPEDVVGELSAAELAERLQVDRIAAGRVWTVRTVDRDTLYGMDAVFRYVATK